MRFSTPMTAKLASAGEWSGYWKGPARAGRRPAVFTGTDSGDPRRGVSRAKSGLFFWTVHGPFSFPQDGKENGGWNGPAIIIAESHGRQVAAPTPLQGRATGGSRSGGVPQSSHSPLWASHHAGNAGSFGERVTGILYLKPEFPFRVNGEIVFEPTPKWKNCKREPLFIVQISPR